MVGDDGEQLGVITRGEALKKASEAGMDLVLVAPKAQPPVAKIIDFAKFKFQQEKKEQIIKKKTNTQEQKEIRLSPFMEDNDLNVRLNRATKFLKDKNKVKFNVWFRGRQKAKKQFGYDLLKRVITELKDVSSVEMPPKLRGHILQMTLKPEKNIKPVSTPTGK